MPRKAKRKLGDPLTEDELQAAFERVMTDPVLGFINGVSLADTQEEVADILAEHRDWLRSLPRKKREDISLLREPRSRPVGIGDGTLES